MLCPIWRDFPFGKDPIFSILTMKTSSRTCGTVFCCPPAYKSGAFDAFVQQKTPRLSPRGFHLSVIPLGLQVFSAFTSKSIIRKILFSLGESIGETPINSQRFKSFNLPLVFQCTGTNISKY